MIKKNTAITGLFLGSFIQTADGAAKTTGTPVGTKIIDGTASTLGATPTYDATVGGWKVTLSAGAVNGDNIGLHFILSACQPIDISISTETKKMADLNDLAAGAQMDLVNAPNGTAVTAIQSGLAVDSTVAKAAACSEARLANLSGASALPSITEVRLSELDAANLPADIDTIATSLNDGTVTLHTDYDAAKTAAQAGNEMDLVNAPNSTALAAIKTALTLPTGIPKNVALPNFTFPMWDISNPEVLKTGLTVTGTIRKDGSAFGAVAGAISEIASTGMYTVDLTQAEMNADLIELLFEAAGGSDQPILIKTNA